jgi:hypothetical protein
VMINEEIWETVVKSNDIEFLCRMRANASAEPVGQEPSTTVWTWEIFRMLPTGSLEQVAEPAQITAVRIRDDEPSGEWGPKDMDYYLEGLSRLPRSMPWMPTPNIHRGTHDASIKIANPKRMR